MATKYARRHYEDIARILAEKHEWEQLVEAFAELFAMDNVKFDRARFLAACGKVNENV